MKIITFWGAFSSKNVKFHYLDVRNVPTFIQITVDPNQKCACHVLKDLPKSSHQVYGLLCRYGCKQVTCGVLGSSTYVYGHQNATRRTWTSLEKLNCFIPLSSFIVRHTRITVSLYLALSWLVCFSNSYSRHNMIF